MSRRKPSRWAERVGEFIAYWLFYFASAWVAMLALGAAHAADQRVPALGFVAVAWLMFVASAIGAGIKALDPEKRRSKR